MKRQYKFNEGIDQATKDKHLKVMCSHADMYMRKYKPVGDKAIERACITDHRGSTNIEVHSDRIEVSLEAFVTDDPLPQVAKVSMDNPLDDVNFTDTKPLWH